ncbi:hypothetical protein HYDPIDRAFT_89389 [Hydnomerulius pinastri MD-312]|uniref:Signal peptidase complex catalytic subunit SEC11 n=1 Tax=Hydnomerulius pinastri MD-312 TaxID=994086 RepID=A0A0C9W1J9_9AGAM|nr:hypothetical protein HYDPIDRAFT_89389 [Hydnomerulius pinastri MD-312]
MFANELKTCRRLSTRHALLQMLSFASAIASCLMLWKGLGLFLNTESPIVVVLSGSMEPAFSRGDLLLLSNPANERYNTGDIIVYAVPGTEIPIVHRIIETHDFVSSDSADVLNKDLSSKSTQGLEQLLLTKGDNNPTDDTVLYKGVKFLERRHVIGKVRGLLPYIGYLSIAINDIPRLKYAVIGATGLLAILRRE